MLPILVGSVAIFAFGALWFTVLFGKVWAKLMGFDASQNLEGEKMSMTKPLILNFLSNVLIASVVYYMFPDVKSVYSITDFIRVVLTVWLGFSFPIFANAAIWERKSWKLVAINSAQSIISLVVLSLIIYYM